MVVSIKVNMLVEFLAVWLNDKVHGYVWLKYKPLVYKWIHWTRENRWVWLVGLNIGRLAAHVSIGKDHWECKIVPSWCIKHSSMRSQGLYTLPVAWHKLAKKWACIKSWFLISLVHLLFLTSSSMTTILSFSKSVFPSFQYNFMLGCNEKKK